MNEAVKRENNLFKEYNLIKNYIFLGGKCSFKNCMGRQVYFWKEINKSKLMNLAIEILGQFFVKKSINVITSIYFNEKRTLWKN